MDFLTMLQILVGVGSLVGAHYERQFIGYNILRARDKGIYRNVSPIQMPENIPSINAIAQDLFSHVDRNKFLFGGSTSEHQSSKKCTPELCSWSRYAKDNNLNLPTDPGYKMDWWNYGEMYIDDAKKAIPGLNAIRFSIELALLQPGGPRSWDKKVADHYAQRFIYLLKKKIVPVVCFHHYTDPNWFLEKGGFEHFDNINYFTRPCIKLYKYIMREVSKDKQATEALSALWPREPLWLTFNSPDGYAFRGYYAHSGPPSKIKSLEMVATVLKNMLEAHVRVYHGMKRAFKKLKVKKIISEPKIGFIKNIHQYDPALFTPNQRRLKMLNNFVLGFADQIQHYAVYNFFINGIFWVQIPLDTARRAMILVDKLGELLSKDLHIAQKVAEIAVDIKYENKKAIGALDFIGLSYYANRYQFFANRIEIADPTLKTESDVYYHYPVGMYRAIVELYERFVKPFEKATQKKLPVIVAENGIATMDDSKRDRFYHEYIYALLRAVKDGYPIAGYMPWALFDNYEWPTKDIEIKPHYGIFSLADNGKHLILKNGSNKLRLFGNTLLPKNY